MLHDLDLYKEFYEHSYRADAQWALILSDEPAAVKELETLLNMTQEAAVDDFIEKSCWSEDLPTFVGKKGTPSDRRDALCRAYLKMQRAPSQTDFSLLTPLEYDSYKLIFELEQGCSDPVLKKRANATLNDARTVAKRAMARRRKEFDALRAKLQ